MIRGKLARSLAAAAGALVFSLLARSAGGVGTQLYIVWDADETNLRLSAVPPGAVGDQTIPDANPLTCSVAEFPDYSLVNPPSRIRSFRYVVPAMWTVDPDIPQTNYGYSAKLKNGEISYSQLAMRVTIRDRTDDTLWVEQMSVGCAGGCGGANCSSGGCHLNTSGCYVEFIRETGTNVSTGADTSSSDPAWGGALRSSIAAGSTIMVEIWTAGGSGDASLRSNSTNPSWIRVPYAVGNFSIWGSVTPQFVPAGQPCTITYVLDNTHPAAPTVTSVDIKIPGNLSGEFFQNANLTGCSRTYTGYTVTPATGGSDGTISVDFSLNSIAQGQTVTFTLTATAPASARKDVKWDAFAQPGNYALNQSAGGLPDALYMAVLAVPAAPALTSVTAANTTGGGGQAALVWDGPNYSTYGITGYHIYRGSSAETATHWVASLPASGSVPTGNSTWKPSATLVTQSAGLAHTDTGLPNGDLCCFAVQAENPIGTSSPSAGLCTTVYAAPGQVASLTALVRKLTVELAWSTAYEATYSLSEYQIERNTCSTCPLTLYTTVPGTSSVLVDGSLADGSYYGWRVRGVDGLGHPGGYSPTKSGRPPVNPPAGLTCLYDFAQPAALLEWTGSANNVYPLSAYRVYRSTCVGCSAGLLAGIYNLAASVYTDATVTTAAWYSYSVSALTDEPPPLTEGSRGTEVKMLTPPATPAALTVRPSPGAALDVEWQTVYFPGLAGGVPGYNVYRSSYPENPAPPVVAFRFGATTSRYVDSGGLAAGQRYYYRVTGRYVYDGLVSESRMSSTCYGVIEPGAPANFAGSPGNRVVYLSWDELRPAQEVDSYRVYRASGAGYATVFVGSAAGATFSDTTVTNGITYHYFLAAVNLGGQGATAYVGSGVTPYAVPGKPASLTAISDCNQVVLNWALAVPATYPIVGYEVYRGASSGAETYHNYLAGNTTSVWADSSQIVNGSPYFYKVRAKDSQGTTGPFSDESTATPVRPPCPPATLAAAASGTVYVGLQWAVVDGASCTPQPSTLPVTGYRVYRTTTPGSGYAMIAGVSYPSSSVYADYGVTAGTTYYYAVRAYDTASPANASFACGTHLPLYSPEAAATSRIPAGPPTNLTILYGAGEHDGKLKLTWTPSVANTLPVVGYRIRRADYAGGPETSTYVPGGSLDTFMDYGVTNGKLAYYRVIPVEAKFFEGGAASTWGTPYVDSSPPAGLVVTERDGQLDVNWNAAAAGTFPVAGYQLYRATIPGLADLEPAARIGPSPIVPTWFSDTTTGNGITYYYHVRTYDNHGHLGNLFSAEASGTPYAVPGPPTGLTLVPSNNRITVAWTPAVPATYAIFGYFIYRSSSNFGGWPCPGGTLVATVTGGLVEYADSPLPNDQLFEYRVAAYDVVSTSHISACSAANSSSAYNTDSPPGQPGNLSGLPAVGQSLLSWAAAVPGTNGIAGYSVFRTTCAGNTADVSSAELLTDEDTDLTYADYGVTAGYVYYYRVRTRDTGLPLYSNASPEIYVFQGATPGGLTALADATAPWSVQLDWTATNSGDAQALQVTGYRVQASDSPGGPYSLLYATALGSTIISHTDGTVPSGVGRYYRIETVHEGGWISLPSATAYAAANGPPSKPLLYAETRDAEVYAHWSRATGMAPISSSLYEATLGIPGDGSLCLSHTHTGLSNGTEYCYQVAAVDLIGNSTWSDSACAFPLGTPRSLSVVPRDAEVHLVWQASPNGTTGISGYLVYRKDFDPASGMTISERLVATRFDPLLLSYTDTGLVNSYRYYYRVRAFNDVALAPSQRVSVFSNQAQGTPAYQGSVPFINTLASGDRTVSFCWLAPAIGSTYPRAGYYVFRSTGAAWGYRATVGPSVSCYTDTGLSNGSFYYYQVKAFDSSSPPVESNWSNSGTGLPYLKPGVPTGLTAQLGNGWLSIAWVAPAWTTFPIESYNVQRATAPGGQNVVTFSSTSAGFFDDTAANGVTYYYRVQAVDTRGYGSTVSAEAWGEPFAPPQPPAGLSGLAGNTIAMLDWAAPAAGTYAIAGYLILRSSCASNACSATTYLWSPSAVTADDIGVSNGLAHGYQVRTIDARGNLSAPSALVSVTPSSAISNPPLGVSAVTSTATGDVVVTWSAPAAAGAAPGGPVARYVILRADCSTCQTYSASFYVSGSVLSFTDTTVSNTPAASYRYVVRAVSASGIESAEYPNRNVAAVGSTCIPPPAPAPFAVTAGHQAADLAWTAPASDCPLTKYTVYRSDDGGATFALIVTVAPGPATFTHRDIGLVNGHAYIYRVTAWNSAGEGGAATSAAVIPAARENTMYLSRNAFAPVRGETLSLAYTLKEDSDVRVGVYALSGMLIYEYKQTNVPAGPAFGTYEVPGPDGLPGWNGTAADGQYVASGVYIIRIVAGSFKKLLKVIVIK